MSIPKKILIDTNIIIGLEDYQAVQSDYSKLNRICGENGIQIFIHESSYEDVEQDANEERKAISLSKLEKYPKIQKTNRSNQQKEDAFGKIKKRNDEVDTDLLVSLSLGIVDLIVTEDKGIISRVKGHDSLEKKVLSVEKTLELLDIHFGIVLVDYKHIREMFCSQFHHDDPFFNSLKADYDEDAFVVWFEKCMRQQRKCWVIQNNNKIAGLIIRNDEDNQEELSSLEVPGNKVLKICLFKTDESISGEKFGEQLLKTALDFAYRNAYDTTFLTVLPKQEGLIRLISRFGFKKAKDKGNECVYFKYTKVTGEADTLDAFEFHKTFWPAVKKTGVSIYLVPIQPEFHARLFPEAHEKFIQQMVFDFDVKSQTPGNAIRKIYVCNALTASIETGSILLFYRTGGDSVITSVGVLEEYVVIADSADLINVASGRSVYSYDELIEKTGNPAAAKAVNFYYAENFENHISLNELKEANILSHAPQSICTLPPEKFDILYNLLMTDKDKEIFYE